MQDNGNGDEVTSIDDMPNKNEDCSPYWQVSVGGDINDLHVLEELVNKYSPSNKEVIKFAMVELHEECGRYCNKFKCWNIALKLRFDYLIG